MVGAPGVREDCVVLSWARSTEHQAAGGTEAGRA